MNGTLPTAPADDTRTLRVTETESITTVDRRVWDLLARGSSFYSSHAWLRYTEQYPDCTCRYLLVHAGDVPVAALPTFRFTDSVPGFYDPDRLFGTAGDGARRPLQLGGTRQGYASEILLRPGLSPRTADAATRLLLGQLRSMSEDAAQSAVLYLTDSAVELLMPHLAADDRLVMIDARARIPVGPGGIADYGTLFSAHRFRRIRKEMRQFAASGCRFDVLPLSECHTDLGPLAAQVLQRYGHASTSEAEAGRFAAQAEQLDDVCRVFVAKHGDRIVGFTQFFLWDGALYGRVHGLDDSMAREAALYYNLTYYQAIEHAARNGLRTIDLGCDSYETKARRGATLEPLWGLVLDAGWTSSTLRRIRREETDRLAGLAGWDPRLETETARRVLARD